MLITKEQADKRLASENNVANLLNTKDQKLTIIPIKKGGGRRDGDTNLSNEERILIGLCGHNDTLKNTAATFNISESTVTNCKNGRTDRAGLERTYRPELKNQIDSKLHEARDLALDKLMASMNLLDDDKLKEVSAKDLSLISSNMSRVYQNTYAKDAAEGAKINIIVYSPELKQTSDYKTIEV